MHQTGPQFGRIDQTIVVLNRQNRLAAFGLVFVDFVVRINVKIGGGLRALT